MYSINTYLCGIKVINNKVKKKKMKKYHYHVYLVQQSEYEVRPTSDNTPSTESYKIVFTGTKKECYDYIDAHSIGLA